MYESELTSFALVRNDTRLIVGSGDGTLYLFKWGDFGYHLERFSGHPEEVHCIVNCSNKLIITGCEDGNIR